MATNEKTGEQTKMTTSKGPPPPIPERQRKESTSRNPPPPPGTASPQPVGSEDNDGATVKRSSPRCSDDAVYECDWCQKGSPDPPNLLQCLHSFCQQCVSEARHGGRITCPKCKSVTTVQEGDHPPIDPRFKPVNKDIFQTAHSGCQTCNCCDTEATGQCSCSNILLCDSCFERHMKLPGKQHKLISLISVAASSANMCKQHPHIQLLYYCVQCNQFMCTICASNKDHPHEHGIITEEQGMGHCRMHVTAFKSSVEQKKEEAKLVQGKTRNFIEALHAEHKNNCDGLKAFVEKISKQLNDWEEHKARQMKDNYEKQLQHLENASKALDSNLELSEKVTQDMNQLLNSPALVQNYYKVLARAEPLLQVNESMESTFQCHKVTFDKAVDITSQLEVAVKSTINIVKEVNSSRTLTHAKSVKTTDYKRKQEYILVEIKQPPSSSAVVPKGSELGRVYTPMSVKFVTQETVVISEIDRQRVQIFDLAGNSVASLTRQNNPDMVPKDAVPSHDGSSIFIADVGKKCVSVWHPATNHVKKWDFRFSNPRSLAINARDQVVVMDNGSMFLTIHNSNGHLIHTADTRQFNLKHGLGLVYPVSIATNSKCHIIISDKSLRSIIVFDRDGVIPLREFTMESEYIQPTASILNQGLTVDQQDHIYVAGYSTHTIFHIDSQGRMEELHIDKLCYPSAVALNNGYMAVCESGRQRTLTLIQLRLE